MSVKGRLRRATSWDDLVCLPVVWEDVKSEANALLERESEFLGSFLEKNILRHNSFSEAIVHIFAAKMVNKHGNSMSFDVWKELLSSCYAPNVYYDDDENLRLPAEEMGLMDLAVVRERDPAAGGLINPFLYFKGYKAIQAHRMAHILWRSGNKMSALAIQSRVSELFDVDIHPAAKVGAGLMIDHGTGIVIGETAVIGQNCSFLHGVTLGGTRKVGGNRHPKLGNDVLVGCCATLLGNISIDSNAKIGSGSVVLTSLPSCVTAVGNPARIVGKTLEKHAASSMDLSLKNVQYCLDMKTVLTKEGILSNDVNLDPQLIFAELASSGSMVHGDSLGESSVFVSGTITVEQFRTALGLRFGVCPAHSILSVLNNGKPTLNLSEYEALSLALIRSHSDDPNHADALEEWEQAVNEGGNLTKFLLAVARLEIEGTHAHPDSEIEVGSIAGNLISEMSLAGIDLDALSI